MITVLCSTLGRPTLKFLVASFVRQAKDTDRLVLIGSAKPGEPVWVPSRLHFGDERVSYVKGMADDWYGHGNVWRAHQRVVSPYWMWLGDDDVLLPGALDGFREHMWTGKLLVGGFRLPSGVRVYPARGIVSEPHRLSVGHMQAAIPKDWEMPDFSRMSDNGLFETLIDQHGIGEVLWLWDLDVSLVKIDKCPELTSVL